MTKKVAYIHNVCMPYKADFLSRVFKKEGIQLKGLFGQKKSRKTKLFTIDEPYPFPMKVMWTLSFSFPYRGRAFNFFLNPSLIFHLIKYQPDVIVAGLSNFPNNFFILLYSKWKKVPYVWHGIGSMYEAKSVFRKPLQIPLKLFYDQSTAGIAFNSRAKRYYYEHYGYPSEKIFIVPNVVNTEKVAEDIRRYRKYVTTKRQELELQDKIVVLFTGAFQQAKKIDLLIRAFSRIEDEFAEAFLLLVGDGSIKGDLVHLAESIGVQNILFSGKRFDDSSLYFLLSDIFVMPGLGGLAISHAMCHGLPIIAGMADGTEGDLIIDGVNGFLLRDGSIEELSTNIKKLIMNEKLRKDMGNKSEKMMKTEFSTSRSITKFVDVINRVAGKKI